MKALTIQLGALLTTLVFSAVALGQYPGSTSYHAPPTGIVIWHHHASTVAEGYARGVAAMLYAQGAYNRMSAEARIAHAQAYAQELENRQRQVDTYFSVRAANRRAQAAERGERPTFDELAQLARQSAPSRLGQDDLDPQSGRIDWPAALRAEKYAAARWELERLFSYRAVTRTLDGQQQRQIQQLTGEMLADLKSDIRQMSPMEYSQARGFLNSLAYEAQRPLA